MRRPVVLLETERVLRQSVSGRYLWPEAGERLLDFGQHDTLDLPDHLGRRGVARPGEIAEQAKVAQQSRDATRGTRRQTDEPLLRRLIRGRRQSADASHHDAGSLNLGHDLSLQLRQLVAGRRTLVSGHAPVKSLVDHGEFAERRRQHSFREASCDNKDVGLNLPSLSAAIETVESL